MKDSSALADFTDAFPAPSHDHRACIDRGLAAAERICARESARLTPDRRQVLEILLRDHAALGAYDIIERMEWGNRKRASSVVYRALEFLSDRGLVHKLHSRNAFIACAYPESAHDTQFLICTQCQVIAEIASAKLDRALNQAAVQAGFVPQSPMVEVEGLCPHCAAEA